MPENKSIAMAVKTTIYDTWSSRGHPWALPADAGLEVSVCLSSKFGSGPKGVLVQMELWPSCKSSKLCIRMKRFSPLMRCQSPKADYKFMLEVVHQQEDILTFEA